MPMYNYHCLSCDSMFDKFLPYDNRMKPENEPCPSCGQGSVKYYISAPKISYSHKGTMRTTDSFNDRMKDIKKSLPEEFKGNINSIIR